MTDLRDHFLARLDARDSAGLAPFVADRVTHNGQALTREGYGAMIAASVAPAPDLRFVPETVLVEGGLAGETRVAARLAFTCTPLRPFLGPPPNGGAVHFTEHAFYRLVDGRITEVWSLFDRAPRRRRSCAREGRVVAKTEAACCATRSSFTIPPLSIKIDMPQRRLRHDAIA